MLGTPEGLDIDTNIDYSDPENLKYKTKVRDSDVKDYEKWKKDNDLEDTDEYDLPGVFYSSGKESPKEIKGLHPDTGMLLMSPTHPEYTREYQNAVNSGKSLYVNHKDKRVYFNKKALEDNVGNLEELPSKETFVNKPIEDEVDEVLSSARSVATADADRKNTEFEFKKKQPISRKLAEAIVAQETAGKTKASDLYKKAGTSQGPHQLTDVAIEELVRQKLVKKVDRNDLEQSTNAADLYINNVIKKKINTEDPELLLAAYNAGPNRILRAIKNANKRGITAPTFDDIRDELSPITINYVENMGKVPLGKGEHSSFYYDEYSKKYNNNVSKKKPSLRNKK